MQETRIPPRQQPRTLRDPLRAAVVHHSRATAHAIAEALEHRVVGLTFVAIGSDLAFLRSTSVDADLFLIEDRLPDSIGRSQGIEVAHRRWPDSTILAIGESDSVYERSIALAAGAVGWVTLSDSLDNMAERIQWAAGEDSELTRLLTRQAASELGPLIFRAAIARARVTPRQVDVLRLAKPPVNVATLARDLGISKGRVEAHLRDLVELLGVERDLLRERALDFRVITDDG